MADISAVITTNGDTYSLKDATARESLVPSGGTTGQVLTKTASGYGWADASGGGGGTWGSITGTLSNQTDLQGALDEKLNEPTTAGTQGQVLAMTSSSEYGWTTIKDANVTYTNVRSETKTLDYVIDSFYFGSRYQIPSGGWVSGTVINNVTYYTYTLNLGRTLNTPNPVIGLQAGSGTLPTEYERRAYNTFDFAFADTNNNQIIFYSRRRPSSTFYVTILGVL